MLNPHFAEAYCKRGLTQRHLGAAAEAEKDFARCLALASELRAELMRQRP